MTMAATSPMVATCVGGGVAVAAAAKREAHQATKANRAATHSIAGMRQLKLFPVLKLMAAGAPESCQLNSWTCWCWPEAPTDTKEI